MMRRLLILGVVLGGILTGADLIAARVVGGALERTVVDAFGIEGDVSVRVRGFPILLQVVQRRLDGIDVGVEGSTIDTLSFERIDVSLIGIRTQGSIFGDGPLAIVVDRIEAGASVDAAAITSYLRSRGHDIEVRFREDTARVIATREVAGRPVRFVGDGTLRIAGRRLIFDPQRVRWDGPSFPGAERLARAATRFEERLPELPADVRVDRVELAPGVASLGGDAEGRTITLR